MWYTYVRHRQWQSVCFSYLVSGEGLHLGLDRVRTGLDSIRDRRLIFLTLLDSGFSGRVSSRTYPYKNNILGVWLFFIKYIFQKINIFFLIKMVFFSALFGWNIFRVQKPSPTRLDRNSTLSDSTRSWLKKIWLDPALITLTATQWCQVIFKTKYQILRKKNTKFLT